MFLDESFIPQEILQEAEGASQDRALSALDAAIIKGIVVVGFTPNGYASYLSKRLIALVEVDNEKCQIPLIDRKVIKSLLTCSQRHFPS